MSGPDGCVAVVIPCFNGASWVLDAVASAREQGGVVGELVVVDNASGDGTAELVARHGVPLVVEAVRGAGAARRRGLEVTRAPYVIFLDHDDLLMQGAASALVGAMVDGDRDIVHGSLENRLVGAAAVGDPTARYRHLGQATAAPLPSSSIVRRTAFETIGPFEDDNFSWPRWIVRAQDAGARIGRLDRLVCTRRIHGDNVSIQEDSYAEYFSLIRARRASRARPT